MIITPSDNLQSLNQATGKIDLYTDGSCHTQHKNGAWACIILIDGGKIILEGSSENTTHQRMELTAVLEGLVYLGDKNLSGKRIMVYTDSQYVADLQKRKQRFITSNYLTKHRKPIRNVDLVKELLTAMARLPVQVTKLKAHQRISTYEAGFNQEVDLLVRKNMRKTK